jgi:hypothetical protein
MAVVGQRRRKKKPPATPALPNVELERGAVVAAASTVAEPKLKNESATQEDEPEDGVQVHVRGVGVCGWDGTPQGKGKYEDESQLALVFGQYGQFLQATVRHRIDKVSGQNTSWALVTMADKASASAVVAAAPITAGDSQLTCNLFSRAQAESSTGAMAVVGQRRRKKKPPATPVLPIP